MPRGSTVAETQVYQVARSVAQAEGEWAEVPRCVREAVLLALTHPQSTPAPGTPRRAAKPSQSTAALPPFLTEAMIEQSIETFEDAIWVRQEAVRTVGQFHNTVESLLTAMGGHLHALWHTAMQLRGERLTELRRQLRRRLSDRIPDGVPLSLEFTSELDAQEQVLVALVEDLERLRHSSVRFTAHFLSDTEKLAMGANPAYLRPESMDRTLPSPSRQTRGRPSSSSGLYPPSPTSWAADRAEEAEARSGSPPVYRRSAAAPRGHREPSRGIPPRGSRGSPGAGRSPPPRDGRHAVGPSLDAYRPSAEFATQNFAAERMDEAATRHFLKRLARRNC